MLYLKGFRLVSLIILLVSSLPARAIPIDACMEQKCVTYFKKWQTKVRKDKGLAMSALGELYYQGYGTKKSLSESIKYFRKASRYQFAYAQYRAGVFYLMEEDFIDNNKGIKYLKKAAKNGHAESAFLLGLIFGTGELGIHDVGESDKWLEQALMGKHAVAQKYASYLYKSGQVDGEHYVKVHEIMTRRALALHQDAHGKAAFINTNINSTADAGQGNQFNYKDYLAESFLFKGGAEENKCEKIFSCYHINNENFWKYAQNK